MLLAIALVFALAGWLGWLTSAMQRRRHVCPVCPIEQPSKAVLVNSSGLPESLRTLRGMPPKTYVRSHGKGKASEYRRVGTAAIYQAPE